jgi:DNA invertase Pin-like site-specific DNA recombinase
VVLRVARLAFDQMLKMVTRGQLDMVAAWSVDRLSRSLQDLVNMLGERHAKHVDLYLHQQGVDTTTPSGKAMFHMCGVFAEFERSILRERVNAGLARAKANGVKLGRGNRKDGEGSKDEHRWRQSREQLAKRVRSLRKDGVGILRIARTLGVGTRLVQRMLVGNSALRPGDHKIS